MCKLHTEKNPGIKQRTAPPAALRWSRHEAVINGSGVIRSQQIHVSREMVIWSGGLIYISQSPSVFIFACKISAWPDIRNAKCHSRRTSSPRGSRAPSQINMQIDDIDFFLWQENVDTFTRCQTDGPSSRSHVSQRRDKRTENNFA